MPVLRKKPLRNLTEVNWDTSEIAALLCDWDGIKGIATVHTTSPQTQTSRVSCFFVTASQHHLWCKPIKRLLSLRCQWDTGWMPFTAFCSFSPGILYILYTDGTKIKSWMRSHLFGPPFLHAPSCHIRPPPPLAIFRLLYLPQHVLSPRHSCPPPQQSQSWNNSEQDGGIFACQVCVLSCYTLWLWWLQAKFTATGVALVSQELSQSPTILLYWTSRVYRECRSCDLQQYGTVSLWKVHMVFKLVSYL